jgi:hypothetical protein
MYTGFTGYYYNRCHGNALNGGLLCIYTSIMACYVHVPIDNWAVRPYYNLDIIKIIFKIALHYIICFT